MIGEIGLDLVQHTTYYNIKIPPAAKSTLLHRYDDMSQQYV